MGQRIKQWSMGVFFLSFLFGMQAIANPYPDPNAVPKDTVLPSKRDQKKAFLTPSKGTLVYRVQVDWSAPSEQYRIGSLIAEQSGTSALEKRSQENDSLGSYRGSLEDIETGKKIYSQTIGTGQEFRLLTRAMVFRFPAFTKKMRFVMEAENPISGVLEKVLEEVLDPESFGLIEPQEVTTRVLRKAAAEPALWVSIYAEGYSAQREDRFWKKAQAVVDTLESLKFPLLEHLSFQAVFAPSQEALGQARMQPLPVGIRNSFLGLYYPYWNNFGRWYHVVYPTSEAKFRDGLGQVAYDYPIILVDSNEYWGVGNYMELTAIPAENFAFQYLLTHEFGHFFGLNEEYESGGKTELAFAPGIDEPWSQNITFLRNPAELKWKEFVSSNTPLPTPNSYWSRFGKAVYGAYSGGYAETEPLGISHKPGLGCVMSSGKHFCAICSKAIEKKLLFDLGLSKSSR